MFEKFVLNKIDIENSILKNLFDSIPEGDNITKKSILTSELSDFTKNYLIYEFNEKTDLEELTSKISKSNKLYFNYAIRPKWTLQTFLFNNFESRPPNEIIKKLTLFTFYSFYTDAVKDFITDNSPIFITKNEVTYLINQANQAIYEKLLNEINNAKIKNFFLQVFLLKYGSESNFNLESTIPYSFIKIFLEDKSFSELVQKFSSVKNISSETELSLKDIIKILSGKYDQQEKSPVISKETEPKKTVAYEVKDVKEKIEIKEDELIEDKIEISEIKNIIIKKDDEKKVETKVSGLIKDDVLVKNKKEDLSDNVYSTQLISTAGELNETSEIENSETQLPPEVDKLKSLFSEKQLEKILNKVYRSDLIYREKSFAKLRDYRTWKEASEHLKYIFQINNVDLYNKYVVSFVNILNEYYQSKE